ncbi:MAG TPA: DEAD/DEAH box helicase, partial [Hyphomicrobiaceae bacterium]|nr:DEAD/DEAH box helicase [Hyphomicrobiaceae bacterium]
IVGQLSSRRQNLFFSATMPGEIAGLANELLRNPVKISVAPMGTTAERVTQRVIHIEAKRKRALLAELLADQDMSRTLVFTRTKRGADRVAKHLEQAGISASAIHGNKSQRQREAALEDFKRAKVRVLVATDIAARGIDVDAVTHVINFELTEVPEAYVHRIGRTARAGAAGSAISLCDPDERGLLRAIERLTKQQIPSEDRRNDQTLEVDKAPERATRNSGNRNIPRRREDNGAKSGASRSGRGGHTPNRTSASRSSRSRADSQQNPATSGGYDGQSLDTIGFLAAPGQRPRGSKSTPERQENRRQNGTGEGGQPKRNNRPNRSRRPSGGGQRSRQSAPVA